MLRTYKKTLTVAVTAIALATASLAATGDAFAKGGGGGRRREGRRRWLGPSSRLRWFLCRRRRKLLGVGARRPGQYLLLIAGFRETPAQWPYGRAGVFLRPKR